MPRSNRSWNRSLFAALLVGGVFAIVESMALGTGAFLAKRGVLYEPAGIDDYEAYLAARDPLLGWPAPGSTELDATGARFAADQGEENCGELYGDSFSYGAGVSDDQTFARLLSVRFGCRIANFAVGGYGSDQSLMRYRARESHTASVVMLAHLSENVMRNVNQYRALLYNTAKTGFKPRFILGASGELVHIPLPEIAPERYASFIAAPENFLEHEYFVPGGASGTNTRRFPHTLALFRTFGHFHVRAQLRGDPWYKDFYRADHPSNALQVTTGIFREFVSDAHARGQTPLALILATDLDFTHRAERAQEGDAAEWSHQPLRDALERENIPYLDTSSGFEERMGGRPSREFFSGEHPTGEGHRMLADIIEAHLNAIGVRPYTRPPRPSEN